MSQQSTSPSQGSLRIQESSSPRPGRFFSLDDVDVAEQIEIQARLTRARDSSYEQAIEKAIRLSLLSSPENQSSQAEDSAGESSNTATEQASVCSADSMSDKNRQQFQAGDSAGDDSLVQRAAVAPQPAARTQMTYVGSSNIDTSHLNDADDEGDDHVPRSRRDRYQHQQQGRTEHRPSLDMMAGTERRPSLDRMNGSTLERRPSLDMIAGLGTERRPSLDRMNGSTLERRPSLEMKANYGMERRPSLDRMEGQRSERRPSLERMQNQSSERRKSLDFDDASLNERRPSLEFRDNFLSERRPSLEQLNDYRSERRTSLDRMERRPSLEQKDRQLSERRPSLERLSHAGQRSGREGLQSAADCLQSINTLDTSSGNSQGINTLRPWPLNDRGIPINWDMKQLPDDKDGLFRLVSLSPIDREYSAITVDFEEAGLKVVSVERLQSTHLLVRFNDEKRQLLSLRPADFELNEKYLYHGTQANRQRLCEEGLDGRLSFQGCFGRGIYFSDNPRKCMNYAVSSNSSSDLLPMILVCRVLLGESKVYQAGIKDSALKREPEKPRAKGGWRYYDSVQGVPVDYPEFVVYENRRVMIEYIVTFEEVAPRPPPTIPTASFYPTPSLYKVEPVTLPIPEAELDEMYMLRPDTDSDGSCDEHTREVEQLRDNVKRGKAQRLGIPYRPPTAEEKRYERLHWKRVCYYSCPPGSPLFETMILKKKQEKADRKKRKAEERAKKAAEAAKDSALGATGGSTGSLDMSHLATDPSTDDYEAENESVAELLSNQIARFLEITSTEDVPQARRYILDKDMDLDNAVIQYLTDHE